MWSSDTIAQNFSSYVIVCQHSSVIVFKSTLIKTCCWYYCFFFFYPSLVAISLGRGFYFLVLSVPLILISEFLPISNKHSFGFDTILILEARGQGYCNLFNIIECVWRIFGIFATITIFYLIVNHHKLFKLPVIVLALCDQALYQSQDILWVV